VSASVVLITGALTGIGRATALAFAREAARIVVSGRRDEAGNALTQELVASAWKLNSFALTFATKTKSAT
jgi:NAD(P)-dependent dehydrogenase (short-subunit alcohol dehydrogenase family)